MNGGGGGGFNGGMQNGNGGYMNERVNGSGGSGMSQQMGQNNMQMPPASNFGGMNNMNMQQWQ
jgi:hypothetical protein